MDWKLILLSGFLAIFLIPQDIESAGGSKIMKYGKKITKVLGSYARPILSGTEKSAGKLTRDVGVASKFTARNVINGIIVANKRSTSLLRLIKKKFFKKKGAGANSSPPPSPAEAPAPSPAATEEAHEEPAAEAPVEHVEAAEETHAEEKHADEPTETHAETVTSGEHNAP